MILLIVIGFFGGLVFCVALVFALFALAARSDRRSRKLASTHYLP